MLDVQLFVHGYAEVLEPAANLRAHWRGSFSDAAREDQVVQSVKHSRECADLFSELVAKQLDGLSGVWFSIALLQESFHVGTDPGHSQQTGVAGDHIVDLKSAVTQFLHEVDENSRIEVAAARSHHHAARRCESHRGVQRAAVSNCRQTDAVAEMGNYYSAAGLGVESGHDVLI
jgi:hypothetical protein